MAGGWRGRGGSGMRRRGHAEEERFACGEIGFSRLRTQVAARARVARWKLRRHLLFACGFKFFGDTKTAVGSAIGEQQIAVLPVDLGAFGLTIRAVRATDVGAFVPCKAEPAEGVEDLLLGGSDEAGAVRAFDAQNELAAPLTRIGVVDQADVGGAGVGG